MRLRLSLLFISAVLGGLASPVGADKVEHWHDRSVDFDAYQKWDWRRAPGFAEWERRKNPDPVDVAIRSSVDELLAAKGFVREREEAIHFWVLYHLRPPEDRRDPVLRSGSGFLIDLSGLLRFGIERRTDNLLYLEVQDFDSEQPVWRGKMRPVLRRKGEWKEHVVDAVRRILEGFPPRAEP